MKIVEKKIVSKEELANYLDEGHFVFDTDNSKHFFSVCFKVPKNQSQGEIAHDEIWTGKLRSLYFSRKSGILKDESNLEIKGFQSPLIKNWKMGTEVEVPFSRILYLVHTEIIYDGNSEFMKTIEKTFFVFHDKDENAPMLESMTATA